MRKLLKAGLLLFTVTLLAGVYVFIVFAWGKPYVRVVNQSAVPLFDVQVNDAEGKKTLLGECQPGHALGNKLQSSGETSVAISFTASDKLYSAEAGYVDRHYCVDFIVLPSLEVKEEIGYFCMKLGRVL